MERSEPSLVPEWLRSTGGGGLSHHVSSSSKADGPLSALPKRSRNLNGSSFFDAPHSSVLERSSSTNSRRSSSSNGSSKHDKNPYSRSYSNSARNQRSKDRDKLGLPDTWDSDYSDPLSSIIGGRLDKDTLRRSQSLISRKSDESMQRRSVTDLRNRSHHNNGSGNGTISVGNASTSSQKVSFEKDFPLLGSDERPLTPDIARVPSPGLSRGVQGLSIGTSPLICCEGWTSALAEVPVLGSNSTGPSPSLHSAPCAGGGGPPSSASSSSEAGTPNGLNMAEALVQGPVRSQNVPQQIVSTQRFEELPSVGSKKLIPMTSSMPKSSILNPSDKLKPKTAARPNDGVVGPKNGMQQIPPLQLGSQARGGSGRADGLNSSSSKLLLLKPGREKAVSSALKDVPAQSIKAASAVVNGLSAGSSSGASHPLKNPNHLKHSNNERKPSAYNLNGAQVVDKRLSNAQLQSRNDFFNLVRKKSMGGTSAAADSGLVVSSALQNSGEEKEMVSDPVSHTENGSEVSCNGGTCNLSESFSDHRGRDSSHHELIHPEEELDFLRALGWEDNGGDDEGLTEEEINAFVEKYMKWRPESKLLQGLQLKIMEENSPASCSTGASSELRTADSSL